VVKRAHLLVLASTVSMIGWGTVLPYQYAYAANTRGWGGFVAAAASSLFSIGALVAAPVGGRLADRMSPVRVAVVARVLACVVSLALVVAGTPLTFLLGMLAFGLAITAAAPAQQVLVLRWSSGADRRRVFALVFSGQALGMAIGAFAAGYMVDLDQVHGMWPAFVTASAGFGVSGLLLAVAGRGVDASVPPVPESPAQQGSTGLALRAIWATPALRWTAVVTIALALAFYAQFESGLPAFALTVLDASERSIGTAAAVNCLVIIALQMAVVRWTATRSAPSLLVAVGLIWVLCWGMMSLATQLGPHGATLFVITFGVFAVGETMYAPVLNPLTASLAPEGMVGTTLGVFAALQTGVSAAGPMLAGLLLGSGLPGTFLLVHAGFAGIAVLGAWRLRAMLRGGPTLATLEDADPLPADEPDAYALAR
jgi:MFS family permease